MTSSEILFRIILNNFESKMLYKHSHTHKLELTKKMRSCWWRISFEGQDHKNVIKLQQQEKRLVVGEKRDISSCQNTNLYTAAVCCCCWAKNKFKTRCLWYMCALPLRRTEIWMSEKCWFFCVLLNTVKRVKPQHSVR